MSLNTIGAWAWVGQSHRRSLSWNLFVHIHHKNEVAFYKNIIIKTTFEKPSFNNQ